MVHILPASTHIDADQMSPIRAADPCDEVQAGWLKRHQGVSIGCMTGALSDVSKARIEALLAEYSTLRAEIIQRSGHRQQLLALISLSAGLVLGFSPGKVGIEFKWAAGIAAALVLLGTAKWAIEGRHIGRLSTRIAQIEQDLDDVLAGAFVADKTITWERARQARTGLAKMVTGSGVTPTRGRGAE